jgi:L-lactate dehydrogenase complex protein LldG
MTAPAESREKILGRIRAASQTVANAPDVLTTAYSTLSRAYVRQGKLTPEASIDLMIERLREYDAEVVECFPAELPAAIAKQLAASGKHKFLSPSGIPSAWQVAGFDWKIDHGLPTSEIEQAEGVLTASSCGIADSGTIVLHHSPTEGRRVLTLLPDWHLCILKASQVVETLPEYFTLFEHAPPIVTWISGPSATADIEMTRIKGVHGPRFLHVILVRDIS